MSAEDTTAPAVSTAEELLHLPVTPFATRINGRVRLRRNADATLTLSTSDEGPRGGIESIGAVLSRQAARELRLALARELDPAPDNLVAELKGWARELRSAGPDATLHSENVARALVAMLKRAGGEA